MCPVGYRASDIIIVIKDLIPMCTKSSSSMIKPSCE